MCACLYDCTSIIGYPDWNLVLKMVFYAAMQAKQQQIYVHREYGFLLKLQVCIFTSPLISRLNLTNLMFISKHPNCRKLKWKRTNKKLREKVTPKMGKRKPFMFIAYCFHM